MEAKRDIGELGHIAIFFLSMRFYNVVLYSVDHSAILFQHPPASLARPMLLLFFAFFDRIN